MRWIRLTVNPTFWSIQVPWCYNWTLDTDYYFIQVFSSESSFIIWINKIFHLRIIRKGDHLHIQFALCVLKLFLRFKTHYLRAIYTSSLIYAFLNYKSSLQTGVIKKMMSLSFWFLQMTWTLDHIFTFKSHCNFNIETTKSKAQMPPPPSTL